MNLNTTKYLNPYHVDSDGNEIYDYKRIPLMFFKSSLDLTRIDEYYAKYKSGDEYYPLNKLIAFQYGQPAYALSADGKNTIFPKNVDGDEMYLYMQDEGTRGYYLGFPKTKENREIYPISETLDSNDETIYFEHGNRYARDENGKFYYPLDYKGNEKIFLNTDDYIKNIKDFQDYPLSNEGTFLVPKINGTPYLVNHFKTNIELGDLFENTKNGPDWDCYTTQIKPSYSFKLRKLDGKYFYVVSHKKKTVGRTLRLNLANPTVPTTLPSTTILKNVGMPNLNTTTTTTTTTTAMNNTKKKSNFRYGMLILCTISALLIAFLGLYVMFKK